MSLATVSGQVKVQQIQRQYLHIIKLPLTGKPHFHAASLFHANSLTDIYIK